MEINVLNKSYFLCIFLMVLGIKNVYIMLLNNVFYVSVKKCDIFTFTSIFLIPL